MAHIARIGSKSLKVRAGIATLYLVLILGAITTVYPFLLMVVTGMKGQGDYNDFTPGALVPRFLYDDAALFNKYAEDKYANNLDDINAAYNTAYDKPQSVIPPAVTADGDRLAESWATFQKSLPQDRRKAGFGEHDSAPSLLLNRFRDWLRTKYHDDIHALNEAWIEENVSFNVVTPPFERTALRDYSPDRTKAKVRDWLAFKQTLPENFLVTQTADPLYSTWLRQEVYEDDINALSTAWGRTVPEWNTIVLPRDAPTAGRERADWEAFVRTKLPLGMVALDATALSGWRAFLAQRERPGASTADLPQGIPDDRDVRADYMAFVASAAPLASLHAVSPENLWRNASKVPTVLAPQAALDWDYVRTHAGDLRWEFATRNFRYVMSVIFLHGNAIPNTVVFCALAILSAVIVNPLCAYALSRYPLPYAYQVLLFLLATMAFPAEVAMIPNFLLLRDLHLLNTFWALILPGLASGFSIFLLKGFFDSLPKELYEAAILDGATEVGMFRTITVPLSLPIFSVIALNAFTASYGAFLFAMVVCQDPKMWTLMVWLYDLQGSAPEYVIMAALTLAAIPTLIVFLFAQRVIMRGIILPSFK